MVARSMRSSSRTAATCATSLSKPRARSNGTPDAGSPHSENVITRYDSDNLSTAGRRYSHFPWIPGINTTGSPVPCWMICTRQFLSVFPVFSVY